MRRRDRDADRRSVRPGDDLARLKRRFAAIALIDFFRAPGKPMAEEAVRALSDALETALAPQRSQLGIANSAQVRGRTWVTRAGIFVDRIASAWLIRRFIDRDARFKFVHSGTHRAAAGEYRRRQRRRYRPPRAWVAAFRRSLRVVLGALVKDLGSESNRNATRAV